MIKIIIQYLVVKIKKLRGIHEFEDDIRLAVLLVTKRGAWTGPERSYLNTVMTGVVKGYPIITLMKTAMFDHFTKLGRPIFSRTIHVELKGKEQTFVCGEMNGMYKYLDKIYEMQFDLNIKNPADFYIALEEIRCDHNKRKS